eukprot:889992-Prorocentrum_minimum.AAC.3
MISCSPGARHVLNYRDRPVRRATCELQAEFLRCKTDGVDGRLVQGGWGHIYFLPDILLCLLPDDHSPVEGGGGEHVAELGVSPADLPHRTLMPNEVS